MELHSEENGDTISVNHNTTTTTLGRSNHPSNNNLTVSRNHVSLKLTPQSTTLTFEVVGKNPILVLTSGGKKKVCGRGEKGELREGDRMSLSIQSPSLWVVKREVDLVVESSILEAVRRRERRTLERRQREEELKEEFDLGSEEESLDFSNIDPVQEFGFLVVGHEFDKYPKGKILPMKNWNWYLDVPKANSDSENDITEEPMPMPSTSRSKSSSSTRKKRGKEGEDDEDWTGESDQDKDLIAKNATGLKRSKYSTRSKDSKMSRNEIVEDDDNDNSMVQNDEDDGGDDETLGGFIVTGDDEDEDEDEEMDNREEEEEEDFEDEEFDD